MLQEKIIEKNIECQDSDDDQPEKPDLPQVKNVSREFIKYRPKMIESPVEYDVLLDIDESKNTFNGVCKIQFKIVNMMANDYIHVDFSGKVNWLV